jgi:putative transposase
MARKLRSAAGGFVYHVLNRAVGRGTLFDDDGEYVAFEKALAEVVARTGMRLLAYCLMPNHWHLLLWPRKDGQLSTFMRLLTVTHVRRWHAHRGTGGTGPLYQGRFKSFPVQDDRHFLIVARYVERNPLRANLVRRAGAWTWSSLWRRANAPGDSPWLAAQAAWPVPAPRGTTWEAFVQAAETAAELEALRRSVARGAPFGRRAWVARTAKRLDLESSLRPRHRPKKTRNRPAAPGSRPKPPGRST